MQRTLKSTQKQIAFLNEWIQLLITFSNTIPTYGLSLLSWALVLGAHFTVESVPRGNEPLTELFYVQKKPKGEKKWERNILIKNKLNELELIENLMAIGDHWMSS